jgi:hypothetical protein
MRAPKGETRRRLLCSDSSKRQRNLGHCLRLLFESRLKIGGLTFDEEVCNLDEMLTQPLSLSTFSYALASSGLPLGCLAHTIFTPLFMLLTDNTLLRGLSPDEAIN